MAYPPYRRFAYSGLSTKTNFALTDSEKRYSNSTYVSDFDRENFIKHYMRSDQPSQSSVESIEEKLAQKKKTLYGSAIVFGTDEPRRVSTYQDTIQVCGDAVARPCEPAICAEVLPPVATLHDSRSTLKKDFTLFHPHVNKAAFSQTQDEMMRIQETHNRDSVGESLLGRRRKMLTRTMVDYRHPTDRVKGYRIENLMLNDIGPSVRGDSIWQSVNNGGKLKINSEASSNFTWPFADNKSMRRFYRGAHNNIDR